MTNHPFKIQWQGRCISTYLYITFSILFITSCATLNEQKSIGNENTNDLKKITYSFYIAGGLGNSSKVSNEHLLERFKEELDNAPENSTLVFTGDNISPTTKNWEKDSLLVQQQLDISANFKGETVFLPGNNEWKSYELDKIEKVENLLKDYERKNTEVVPNNGCQIH